MVEVYQYSINDILTIFKTQRNGLNDSEVQARLVIYGKNLIERTHIINPWVILFMQFANPVVWVLFGAGLITAVLKEYIDSIVIGIVIFVNTIFGFVQEYHAEKSIEALRKTLGLQARVFRNGNVVVIDATNLVPGDIVLLDTGDKIPADCRLIECVNLKIQEASLTGESMPVKKTLEALKFVTGVANQQNMVFASTVVVMGRGVGVVTSTGFSTQVGKIAHLIEEALPNLTPLQKRLKALSVHVTIGTILVCLVVFVTGVFYNQNLFDVFLQSVSLAVAAIPEGLPAVVTITLALGVRIMAANKALVRKLPSVETLGACTVICSDKTGTLTHNEMTVQHLYVDQKIIHVSGTGYRSQGTLSSHPKEVDLLVTIGALCNNARLEKKEKLGVIGDPTEAALLVSSEKAGLNLDILQKQYPRVDEISFSSERKCMTTIHGKNGRYTSFMKGASEIVLACCTHVLEHGTKQVLSVQMRKNILSVNEAFANQGLRVLGFAYKNMATKAHPEEGLVFVGLQAMIDPPRPEVREAIKMCHKAGIKVVMITGDHISTAVAISKEIGILGKAVSGDELSTLNLDCIIDEVGVYARVDPVHKLRIVEALKKKGHVVAMTGDGVNDAPALKSADIGIAMGMTGTDVAKEASVMVLADDNFATIVSAIKQGRKIYDNIKKFVVYLLSSNMGEVLTVFVGALLGLPLILIARQILWVNLVTDLLPALALGQEPEEPSLMERPPQKASDEILSSKQGVILGSIGLYIMAGTLLAFMLGEPSTNLLKSQTLAFTTLVFFQLFNVFLLRSQHHHIWELKINWMLIFGVGLSVVLQIAVVMIPSFSVIFGTTSLNAFEWLFVLACSSSLFIVGELSKGFINHWQARSQVL
ncbi:MAG: calcium-translocating P-type ATPase, PMCA-type [Nanoarchaeota archaeon]